LRQGPPSPRRPSHVGRFVHDSDALDGYAFSIRCTPPKRLIVASQGRAYHVFAGQPSIAPAESKRQHHPRRFWRRPLAAAVSGWQQQNRYPGAFASTLAARAPQGRTRLFSFSRLLTHPAATAGPTSPLIDYQEDADAVVTEFVESLCCRGYGSIVNEERRRVPSG
jgi:hypothetical protein